MAYKLNDKKNAQHISNWEPLVAIGAAVVLPLSTNFLVSSPAIAQTSQEITSTWGETISLASILTGYQSLLLGLEEVGIGGDVIVSDHLITYSDTFAAFTFIGTIDNIDLILNGNGSLIGEAGVEDLVWDGSWLGTLGDSSFILTSDSASFAFDGTNGYEQLSFTQSGSLDADFWDATVTGDLTSKRGTSLLPGWAQPGSEGIGGTVDQALGDLETVFLLSGNTIGSNLLIDGNSRYFQLALDNSTIIKEGFFICEENKNCTKASTPESASISWIASLLVFGFYRQLKKVLA